MDELLKLIDDGESISGIAKALGVHRQRVANMLKDAPEEYRKKVAENARKKSSHKEKLKAPPEFAADAETMTADALAKKYRKRKDVVLRWRKELGIVRVKKGNRLPASVVEMARTMSVSEIFNALKWNDINYFRKVFAAEYPDAFERAKKNHWPADFPTTARSMTISAAAEHWKKDKKTIRRWALQIGGGLLDAMAENGRAGLVRGGQSRAGASYRQKVKHDTLSFRELAMSHIRRKPGVVCYSDKIYGGKGDVFFVGAMKMTYEQMVEFAKKHGFSLND